MAIIKTPNLPKKKVKAVLISGDADKSVLSALEDAGIEAIPVPACRDLAQTVSSHPDMLFHHLGGNHMAVYQGADQVVCGRLQKLGFELEKSGVLLTAQYPNDVALNAARVENYLFCNVQYIDPLILDDCRKNKIHIVSVKQGYTKCSVCVVDNNSIITADSGIAAAASKCGLDVLKIREGFIKLPGYEYGFIGGCCGKLAPDVLTFCGDLSAHPDFPAIDRFLRLHAVTALILGNGPLFDIGSILPLLEQDS